MGMDERELRDYRRGTAALYRLADASSGTPLGDAARHQAEICDRALALGGEKPVRGGRDLPREGGDPRWMQ